MDDPIVACNRYGQCRVFRRGTGINQAGRSTSRMPILGTRLVGIRLGLDLSTHRNRSLFVS